MTGLACCVCGCPWKLDRPLLYHHDKLHCDSHACSRECAECKDWERAITENGAASPADHGDRKREENVAPAAATNYQEMMKKIRGGK